ncbi:TATA box-binding protein-associated factor RNA polymerase I subunit D-like [Scyliorhinus canicula]|uniref:TATA box-binding protein-associated factor RNA polymerase I subunit D-like n=1 Tax=Scyliorhinus canicula TaxID=7830 RepID=UPI0018F2E397|nr:TATA box-binding protein-associated factor RNA polymerase I subunit D-like [Scyliorhinus canicula]XP_038670026.1 TATA box-binding protein-associated factor RNA polymerase I subunit D-like [Scyliorhinus canicula]XP_038670027.1 TATA box-binding protein-associated factor RNA polymerase I subunit D-like [Scyliorhinus canicula]XP_038670028.1 TATA box-binding protein-associated factor RNA polymerase I subunit D-like [Scyliorhinus canicula]
MEDEMNMTDSKGESENSVLLFSEGEDEIEQLLQKISRETVKKVTEQVDTTISIHSSEGDCIPDTVQHESQLDVLNYQPVCLTSFSLSAHDGKNAVELSEQDSSDSLSNLFLTQCPSIPVRKARRRGRGQFPTRSAIRNQIVETTDSSSDSDGALGHPDFVMVGEVRRRRRRKRPKVNPIYKKTGRPRGRPCSSTTRAEKRKRLRERGLQFPFVHKEYGRKDLPFKMIFTYEHAALCGLFTYMKELKYQKKLINSLKKINVDNPEGDNRPVRQHKYLDEKRSISPIPESGDETCIEDAENEDTFDVKIVENSCFVMENRFLKKKKCLRKKNSNHKNNHKGKHVTNAKSKDNPNNKRVTVQLEKSRSAKTSTLKHFKHKTRCIMAEQLSDQVTPDSPLLKSATQQSTCEPLENERT